ncbi:MAG: excinuclease ABC subunit UvrC [Candidatus Dojkabacteria bacterium]
MDKQLTIQQQLDLLPISPGVYKFYDKEDTILYIGKALNLNSRVSSYFTDSHFDRPQIIPMIPKIVKIETVQTENEVEALVLEAALIKLHQPYYNSMLKDDKSYAWIYISTRDPFPTVKIVRSLNSDEFKKGRLFGPYPSGRAVKRIYKYIRKLYPFCTCETKRQRENCLYVHLGYCPGPYHGYVTREQYLENIGEIIKFLSGKKKRHLSELENEMREYAKAQNFEEAARLRDKILDLKHLSTQANIDYAAPEENYLQNRSLILKKELEKIAQELNIPYPKRIECYDISNIQGEFAYGSMVVSIDGERDTSEYRVFKIKNKSTPDDFEMLNETLSRRIQHINNPNSDESLKTQPDIFLIDGGAGQLNAVRELIPKESFLLGITKGRKYRRKGGRKIDEFWVNRNGVVLQIRLSKPRILIALRDEAHRFALKHHRRARQFAKKKSMLDEIKGIGPVKKKALIQKFGSVKELLKADFNAINEIVKNPNITNEILTHRIEAAPEKV